MPSIIEVEKISKAYGGAVYALKDVSLSIEAGDIFGIIGLSGAGKSTLIRSLARLTLPSSGRILFHGKDIGMLKKEPLRKFRRGTGMIFQHFNLLQSRTVFGNIAYPLEISGFPKEKREARIEELLKLVGLLSKRDAYPSELSGGEKQRVGIARALANHPEVLFCDEATSALDPKTTQEILNLLKTLNRQLGVTIVLITHQMEVIKQICNKVAVLEEGCIVEEGPVGQIFAEPKHSTTKRFLQNSLHELPERFFKEPLPTRRLLRLSFKGEAASKPVIAQMIRKFEIDVNILLGWLDNLQTHVVGTLVIEVNGSQEKIEQALSFLSENDVHFEVMER